MINRYKYFGAGRLLLIIGACISGLLSFTPVRVAEDFLKQLGISEQDANNRISQGFLTGYVNTSVLSQARNIPLTGHSVIVTSAVNHARKFTESDSFKTAYENMRQQKKPSLPPLPVTPDSLRQTLIENATRSLQSAEVSLKSATGDLKQMMEELVKTAKETLKEAKSPDNAYLQMYTGNYASLLQQTKESRAALIEDWEKRYPLQAKDFVKMRLEQFLKETEDIDFNAETVNRNGKQVFVNTVYERKGKNWKLAYRMGSQVIETARKSVKIWMDDLNKKP
ncbi:MAG: hypothetical protein KIT80_12925 [Chitinophagaceae bacterium]|nr:hypothetical protein [Chitinophagaceae bacterium]MCW5927809.1 hypothetical protein [Chitinophagaceae bacterium]